MPRPSETQKLISSLGVFSGRLEAVAREIGRTNSSMKLMADQQARFSTAASTEIKKAMTEAIKDGMSQAAAQALPMPAGVVIPDYVPDSQSQSGVKPAGGHRPRAVPGGESEGGGVRPVEERHKYEYEDSFKRGYRIENLQKDVGHKVTEMLQNREGRVMESIEAEHGFTKNTAGQWIHKASGRFASGAETEAMEGNLARAAGRYGTARNLTGALAEGQGVKEAIGAAFPGLVSKVAFPLAVAKLTDQALDFATAQREQNREWQKITGGSNISAYGERAKSQVFEWGMKGIMGAGSAEELYMGAARMGLRGDERNRALDFSVANFKKYGMDVKDSLDLINTALESSNSSLSGLGRALEGVSNQAKAAGRNVDEARKAFGARYEQVTQTIGGTAAVAVAAGQTEASYSLGRGLENVTFATDPAAQRLQAITLGYRDVPSYLKAVRESGGTKAAEGQAAVARSFVRASAGPAADRLLPEFQARKGWGDPTTWNTSQTEEFGRAVAEDMGMDPEVMQGLLRTGGVGGVTPEKAPQMFGEILTGRLPGQLVEKTQEAVGKREAHLLARGGDTRMQQTGGQSSGIIRAPNFFGGGERGIETSVSSADVKGIKTNIGFRDTAPKFGRHGKTQTLADARRLYLEKVTREGGHAKADPKIEKLLQDGYKGKFIVQTKDGEKAVDFEDAINHYWDQLRAGTAEIGEGEHRGETVAGAFNADVDKSVTVTSDEAKGSGQSADEYRKKVAGDVAGGGKATKGTVVIEMQPELRRLLGVKTHGDVVYNDPNAPRTTNPNPTDLSK